MASDEGIIEKILREYAEVAQTPHISDWWIEFWRHKLSDAMDGYAAALRAERDRLREAIISAMEEIEGDWHHGNVGTAHSILMKALESEADHES